MSAASTTVAILAGGAATRLEGRDKGLQPLGGRPLIAWVVDAAADMADMADTPFADRLIVANRHADEYAAYATTIRDDVEGFRGPLAGIAAALRHCRSAWLLTLPVDCPRPPSDLQIAGRAGHWLLGFTSLVDNVGLGPGELVGMRKPGRPRMNGTQRVRLSNGEVRTYDDVAQFRYTNSPPHHHWHLMRFDSFELRDLDGRTLVRDRKSGFCLADHWGIAPGRWPGRRPHFLGDCEQYHPEATRVVMGTTPGYTDRYPAFFHGQNVDITGVRAGTYDLLHRVNAAMQLHELRYDNDAASVRIRLRWVAGAPKVTVLRSCTAGATC